MGWIMAADEAAIISNMRVSWPDLPTTRGELIGLLKNKAISNGPQWTEAGSRVSRSVYRDVN